MKDWTFSAESEELSWSESTAATDVRTDEEEEGLVMALGLKEKRLRLQLADKGRAKDLGFGFWIWAWEMAVFAFFTFTPAAAQHAWPRVATPDISPCSCSSSSRFSFDIINRAKTLSSVIYIYLFIIQKTCVLSLYFFPWLFMCFHFMLPCCHIQTF